MEYHTISPDSDSCRYLPVHADPGGRRYPEIIYNNHYETPGGTDEVGGGEATVVDDVYAYEGDG
jgi:hypothetical protein